MIRVACKHCSWTLHVAGTDDARAALVAHSRTHPTRRHPSDTDVWHREHPVLHDDYFGNIRNPRSLA